MNCSFQKEKTLPCQDLNLDRGNRVPSATSYTTEQTLSLSIIKRQYIAQKNCVNDDEDYLLFVLYTKNPYSKF